MAYTLFGLNCGSSSVISQFNRGIYPSKVGPVRGPRDIAVTVGLEDLWEIVELETDTEVAIVPGGIGLLLGLIDDAATPAVPSMVRLPPPGCLEGVEAFPLV